MEEMTLEISSNFIDLSCRLNSRAPILKTLMNLSAQSTVRAHVAEYDWLENSGSIVSRNHQAVLENFLPLFHSI